MNALLLHQIVYGVFTLYMMLIILRWLSGPLSIDLELPRWRWIKPPTEPLIDAMRRFVPTLGPFDAGPIAALFVLWLSRIVILRIIENSV